MELDQETPLVEPGQSFASITDKISSIVLERTSIGWYIGFGFAAFLLLVYLAALGYLLFRGVGIWGINIPVSWGFAIINFIWWTDIGHAGTFISAVLLLLRADWRTSISRFAEAMTLIALINALLFPLLHLGRPWFFFWMFPYPNSQGLWPQFRSPLVWDLVTVTAYFIVSLLFWYMGLIPDMAVLRDRARAGLGRRLYGLLALGWAGSAFEWRRYEMAYFLVAALATPLVISVHSVGGLDFAFSVLPGWHSTLAPPFFVVGAIFSGFAMVILLAIPLRTLMGLEAFITRRHLDTLGKFLLAASLLVTIVYILEIFAGLYSNRIYEEFVVTNRLFGPYAFLYWAMVTGNVLVPQALWFKSIRHSPLALFIVALIVLISRWLERFIIVVVSLHRDFLPSAWDLYVPTMWDWATFIGSIGLFLVLMFLFIRFLPAISIFEMRELVAEEEDTSRENVGDWLSLPTTRVIRRSFLPTRSNRQPYGLLAEFTDEEHLLEAARMSRTVGYRHMDAYTPFSVDGLAEVLGYKPRYALNWLVLVGLLVGAAAGFGLQYYTAVIDYPVNIGGRPINSWPAFIPITFATMILVAALTAFAGMLILNGLPAGRRAVFQAPRFGLASRDRFFLLIRASDPHFNSDRTGRFLTGLEPVEVSELEAQ